MKTKHFFFYFLFINLNLLYGQDISSTATNTIVEFSHSEGYTSGDKIALEPGWMGSTNWKTAQVIYNNGSDSGDGNTNRLVVKRKYQRSQKNQPLQANSGEIITLKMIFRPNGTANAFDAVDGIASGQLFAFGLKDSFDTSDTQPATTANGEVIGIEIDADNKLGIQYKADTPQLYSYNYWNSLTIKFFVGNNLDNSSIKIKLEHNTGTESMITSGWLDHTWDSQSLYDAVIGNGAYMIFQSGDALGTDTSATQIYIDKYSFHTGDSGQLFLGGSGFTSADSWSAGTLPNSSDRLFIFNKSPNLNNALYDFGCSYLFIDSNSTFNVTKSNSINIDNITLDGVLNILTYNNTDSSVKENNINVNNNLSINGTLNISPASSLSVSGNFTNNGTVTLNSDADEFSSIIVEGTSSGNITYNRYVNTAASGEWDLIGSPVDGLSISSFITANGSSLASNGTQHAIGRHFNDTDSWKNYASDGYGTNTLAIAGDFNLGEGYQMGSTSGETLAFTGTVATSAQTQSVINNDGNGSGGRRWNLVANPFPSYLNLNTQAHATNNFLKVNIDSGVIDSSFGYLYGWDADGSGYTIYNNNASDGFTDYIAPGQGFFVAAASQSAANISFTTAMRTTSGGDDFVSDRLAQSTWSRFYLRLYQDENFTSETQFYFDQGLSLGLDPGHDAGAPFEDILMSRLVEQDQGIGMAINAMGLSAFDEETLIPLVLNRDAGVEFSISFEDSTIPEDVGVYLEDTLLETLTDLRSSDFTLTPESDLFDMGRFYLRIGNTSLGGDDLDESYISIYKAASDDFLTIEGLSNGEKVNVELFNIMGQQVLTTTLNSNQSTQRVSTSGLTTGIYVIRLQADRSVIAKKIIIN